MFSPYTYRIGWSRQNIHYYGLRLRPKCHCDIWIHYFTSSYRVHELRREYGEPDIIEVRKIFNDDVSARLWEAKVLRRLKVLKRTDWLNNYAGTYKGSVLPKSESHKRKIGESNRGKSRPWTSEKVNKNPEKIRKTAEKHTGMKRSTEAKENMAVSRQSFFANGGSVANKGLKSFYDPQTLERHDFILGEEPPGWIRGNPKKGKKCYWDGKDTSVMRKYISGTEPEGWILGNPLNPNKRL